MTIYRTHWHDRTDHYRDFDTEEEAMRFADQQAKTTARVVVYAVDTMEAGA